MKGDKMERKSSFGSMVRKRLSDITNSLPHPKSPTFPEDSQADNASAHQFIEHLVEEKLAMVKLIQEKNKIIEFSGAEIRNLRSCLQKMQLQNWTLAQTNSHMLAEVNSGKQRLIALQHEVACKDTLLKAKILQMKGKEEVDVQKQVFEELEEVTEGSEMNKECWPRDACRRRRLSRSASLGSSRASKQHAEKETALSKRRCMRRQSDGRHDEATGNMLELENVNVEDEDVDELGAETGRRSLSRPSRKAVEKVESYKERALNIKMRRPR